MLSSFLRSLAQQPDNTPMWVGGVAFAIMATFMFAVTLLCVYESVALFKGWAPLTQFIRSDIDHHRMIAIALTGFICILIGHFWR